MEGFGDPMKEFWLGMISEVPGGLWGRGYFTLKGCSAAQEGSSHPGRQDTLSPVTGTGHSKDPDHQGVSGAMLRGRFSCAGLVTGWACHRGSSHCL